MNVKAVRLVLSLTAALIMAASLSFARSWFGKSSTKSYSVTLASAAKLRNGAELPAGDYTLKIPENTQTPEVEFYAEGKLVAKEQAKVQAESQKNAYTALELSTKGNTNVIIAVDPGGMSEKLVFSSSNAQSGS